MITRIVTDKIDLEMCLGLRADVFIGEQNVSEEEERDGLDPQCVHILATDQVGPVGTARVNYLSPDYAKIQRVCILPRARGTGAGATLMRFLIETIRADATRSVIRLGAQTHALDFYRKLGFTEIGEEFLDAGIPHREMELRV